MDFCTIHRFFWRIFAVSLAVWLLLLAGCAGHEGSDGPRVRTRGQMDTTISVHH